MRLRGYQEELISKARLSFKDHRRVLCVAPCGAGKTLMFAYMCISHVAKTPNANVWFLVHRQELMEQTRKAFEDNGLSLEGVTIAMAQTVSRRLDSMKAPTMIVLDECQHCLAKTWLRIIERYPNVPIIGLTATPCRLDGKPLGDVFDCMAQSASARWLIGNGYLADFDYYAPHIDLEEAKWQMKGSDYDQQSVAQAFDKAGIYGDALKYLDLAKKTIIYCPTIAFSETLADRINRDAGARVAAHFDGNTNDGERKAIIADFRAGRLRVLLNVDLIGEGFDVPDCDCVMLLRPTMSVALYIQQSMRCLRYKEGKRATIYDFVGNVFKHGLPTDEREWSLTKAVKPRKRNDKDELIVRECGHCLRVYKGSARICPYCGHDNGKTRKEIEQDKKAELEKINALERKKERMEVGMARTFQELVALGKRRGYRNPAFWAQTILKARNNKNI